MDPERLWAKSWDAAMRATAPRSAHFAEHLRDVHAAAARVVASTGDEQLTALGLEPSAYRDRFRRIVLLAAAVHDLGKANDHFQGMLRGVRDVQLCPQALRHEWVTILMLAQLRPWLLPAMGGHELDFATVEWAVGGHHPAMHHSSPPRSCPAGAGTQVDLLMGHDDFRRATEWLQETFGLDTLPTLSNYPRALVGKNNVFQDLARWHREAQRRWERLRNFADRRLVAAVKNCLVAGDVAGSALPRVGPDDPTLWNWIDVSFANKAEPGDLGAIVRKRLKDDTPRNFQLAVRHSAAPVTFVKAGCGSGKTLAAYMWAAQNHPTRRLYFCYPTTGTATEGFKDYLFEPDGELGELGAKLFHSRRDVDFEIILSTGRDTSSSDDEAAIRVESLEAWSTPIVACTVDTVLGILQNNRRGLFAWPALAQAAFVFDEIHAFDDRLFGALLRFLRDLPRLPVLLMTASLPEARETALRNVLNKRRESLVTISGPDDLERLPRYHRVEVDSNDPLPLVESAFTQGGKVLWVCNTVDRVMAAAERAATAGLQPLIYHSRFRYEDRVARHKAVIEAFSPGHTDGVVAVTSQVCEMSLDLKGCTLLITELAPVPPLIQRLGRLNRQAKQGDPTQPFVVIEPDNHLPYAPPELDAARAWLAELTGSLSQRNLADHWEQADGVPRELVPSAWLDGGPVTAVTELREASPGLSILREQDRAAVIAKPRSIGRYILPMPPPPRSLAWKSWPCLLGVPIAPADAVNYDALRGAAWSI